MQKRLNFPFPVQIMTGKWLVLLALTALLILAICVRTGNDRGNSGHRQGSNWRS